MVCSDDSKEDNDAIARALGGNEEAWGWLVEKYRTYAYRIAWRVTYNEEDALDAVQEMLLKMAGGLQDFRGVGSLRSWVTTIAIREATNICRRRARVPAPMDPDDVTRMAEAGHLSRDAVHPGNALDMDRHMVLVRAGMEQLSPQQRAILLLAVENDIGPSEIARELGLPANQVRSQQARAICKLREILNIMGPQGTEASEAIVAREGNQDEE